MALLYRRWLNMHVWVSVVCVSSGSGWLTCTYTLPERRSGCCSHAQMLTAASTWQSLVSSRHPPLQPASQTHVIFSWSVCLPIFTHHRRLGGITIKGGEVSTYMWPFSSGPQQTDEPGEENQQQSPEKRLEWSEQPRFLLSLRSLLTLGRDDKPAVITH